MSHAVSGTAAVAAVLGLVVVRFAVAQRVSRAWAWRGVGESVDHTIERLGVRGHTWDMGYFFYLLFIDITHH